MGSFGTLCYLYLKCQCQMLENKTAWETVKIVTGRKNSRSPWKVFDSSCSPSFPPPSRLPTILAFSRCMEQWPEHGSPHASQDLVPQIISDLRAGYSWIGGKSCQVKQTCVGCSVPRDVNFPEEIKSRKKKTSIDDIYHYLSNPLISMDINGWEGVEIYFGYPLTIKRGIGKSSMGVSMGKTTKR